MRAILTVMIVLFAVSACGKKAPLRPPEEPETLLSSPANFAPNG